MYKAGPGVSIWVVLVLGGWGGKWVRIIQKRKRLWDGEQIFSRSYGWAAGQGAAWVILILY